MWIYLTLLVPVLVIIVAKLMYDKFLSWYEMLGCIVITLIILAIGRGIGTSMATADYEYWNGYATEAIYYEDWNEEVTYYVTVTHGSGKYEYTTTEARTRVDYHPEFWVVNGTLASSSISKKQFDELTKLWGNKRFVDMHRDYDTNDGDSYVTTYDKVVNHTIPQTLRKCYTNKLLRSKSVFNFEKLTKEEKKLVYDYPTERTYNFNYIIGDNNVTANKTFAEYNAVYGANKKVTMFLLVFKDVTVNSIERAYLQERYWFGGNKNEIVTCVGVNKNKISWVKTFSWSDEKTLLLTIDSNILKEKTYNINSIVCTIVSQVNLTWKKKDFKEFDYVEVDLPDWANILTILLSFIGCGVFLVFSLQTQEKE